VSGPNLTATAYRAVRDRLSTRDLIVARHVTHLRYLSGGQLARLCFVDTTPHTARQGLVRVTRLGVLDRLPRPIGGVRAGSVGFVYYLGRAGQRLAVEQGWTAERRTRRSLVPGTLFVRHALMVSELHVRLIEAERRGDFDLLTLQSEPTCWRADGSLVLKPDSFVRLGIADFEYSYFIEIDRGTEGSQTISRQLKLYADYFASGREQAAHGVFPRALWLVPDERRKATIGECIKHQPAVAQSLFQIAVFERALEVMVPPPDLRTVGGEHDE
jgi:hypothetical protein